MNRRNSLIIAGLCAVGLGVVPAIAQVVNEQPEQVELPSGRGNTVDAARAAAVAPILALRLAPLARWREMVFCTLDRASEVQRYAVDCQGATRLNAQVADCCMAGDHWALNAKVWDSRPNTAVASSPGGAGVFGVNARVYKYGGTSENRGHLYAEVDCSFLHGVDVFPAGSSIVLSSDGSCKVRDLGKRDAINTVP